MSKLKIVSDLSGFFAEMIQNSASQNNIQLRPEVEVYLAQLLCYFGNSDKYYSKNSNGENQEIPLFVLLSEAFDENTKPENKKLIFRHIGDLSLYTAGFFQESLQKKMIDLNYYIEIGESAYQNAASLADKGPTRVLYSDLSKRFQILVKLLVDISEKTTPVSNEMDVLKAYDLWVSTKSNRAAKALSKAGIDTEKSKRFKLSS